MVDLNYLSIKDAHELLQTGEVSCIDLTTHYLDRIKQLDSTIKAVLTICEDTALASAKEVDAKIQAGETIGVLEGIPYTAKDMFLTRGIRTTAASKILDNFVPPYSATVIEKLNAAGAVLLAKVNQDEFAHGGSTENSAYAKTTNPHGSEFVPGGSSGGSAAAVAADFGIFSIGTDTGGSIRQPAAYCGVTGLKPTYGLVSRYGVVAMASSFDCIGPLTRSAQDAATVLAIIAGRDSMDSTTISSDIPTASLKADNKLRVGVVKEFENNPGVANAVEVFTQAGHEISKIDLPDGNMALAAYYVLVPSEISSNLERYDGIRYGEVADDAHDLLQTYTKTRAEYLGPEVKRRILTGTYALSAGYYDAYYKKAMQVRTLIANQFSDIFKECDLIICPTTLAPAFKLGDKSDPIEMYKTDVLTVSANLAGLPAVSIPSGIDSESGLPLGLQIIGKQTQDEKVLALANEFQDNTDWHSRVSQSLLTQGETK